MARITEILMEQNPIYNRQALNQPLPTMREKLAVRPSKSKYTIAAEGIQTPDATLGYVKGGNLLTAITNGLKSGLGFYGAMQDRKAEQEYNQALADLAEKERADKLAQQAFENDYKDREIAQKAELAQSQYANQKDIAQIHIDADALRAKQARENALIDAERQRQYALEDRNYKTAQEQELYKRGLLEQGIDPNLYGKDAQYTALINQAKKQQSLQDQLNAANIKLGESGKVGMDKVQQVIQNPSRKLQYGDNSLLANFLGINKFGISRPQADYQAPSPLSDITNQYRAKLQSQANNNFTQVSNEDLLKGL